MIQIFFKVYQNFINIWKFFIQKEAGVRTPPEFWGGNFDFSFEELLPGTKYAINVTTIYEDGEIGETVRTSAKTSEFCFDWKLQI